MNIFKYVTIFTTLTSISEGYAAQRNLCDDLIDSGTSSPEQIKKCLNDSRFGPSQHYKEQESLNIVANEDKARAEKAKTEAALAASADALKKASNLEFKKFSEADLLSEGFGKPFYAFQGDRNFKSKRIVEGDVLCNYLGYEKAQASTVSEELWENKNGTLKVDKEGLIFKKNLFGYVSKKPEAYHDDDNEYTVRKYVEITCVRRKDKNLNDSADVLKVINEVLSMNDDLNKSSKPDKNLGVNDSSIAPTKVEKTPYSYTSPLKQEVISK
jgi:hypothetical protein